jgi:branched-chain amino acid transport system ATP-binding protein
MTAPVLLEINDVSKRFGQVLVADQLSIEVPEGATLGVVGPNGAGKTSLFAMVSGDIAVDSGDIRFAGASILGMNAARRCRLGIGRTFQVPHPFVGMTVFENVLVAAQQGAGLRRAAATDLALDAIAEVGLTAHMNTTAGRLGLLSRKRLEVARALATGPKLLLLDEPSSGLNTEETSDLTFWIEDIKADLGITVLMIEHDMSLVGAVSDRVLVMNAGRVLALGSPAEVQANPDVVAAYLGE